MFEVSDAVDSASAVGRETRGGERVGGERLRETRRSVVRARDSVLERGIVNRCESGW